MEIRYNMEKNYRALFDEANGIFGLKNKLLKNEKIKIYKFTTLTIIYFWIIEIFSLITLFMGSYNYTGHQVIRIASIILIFAGVLYLIFSFMNFFITANSKLNSHKGIVEIKVDGILDKSENGNNVQLSYNNIECMVITKNLIVFITNGPIMIFIPNNNKDEVVNKIKEYSRNKDYR